MFQPMLTNMHEQLELSQNADHIVVGPSKANLINEINAIQYQRGKPTLTVEQFDGFMILSRSFLFDIINDRLNQAQRARLGL